MKACRICVAAARAAAISSSVIARGSVASTCLAPTSGLFATCRIASTVFLLNPSDVRNAACVPKSASMHSTI